MVWFSELSGFEGERPFFLGFFFSFFFVGIIFVFQGGWLFGFLAFVAFTWVFVAFHVASSAFTVPLFRILCIASSAGFLASAFPVGFWPWLPASSASQVPLWCPPPPPFRLKYTPT